MSHGNRWLKEHPERNQAAQKKYRRRIRSEIMAALGAKCSCCGESDPRFLTVDHIYNDGAEEREKITGSRRNGGWFDSWLHQQIVKNEVRDRYRLMCYNCNCGRQNNGGICPHQDKP